MSAFREQYRQLLSMAQSHLLTEYPRDQQFISDPKTVQYYKTKQVAPKAPIKPIAVPSAQQQQQLQKIHYQPPKPTPPAPIKPAVIAPPPPPKAEEKKPLEVPKRERFDNTAIDDMSDIRALVTKLYPQMHLSAPPTSDNTQLNKNTQPIQVYVFQNENTPSEETFLHYFSDAINRMIAPAMVVDGFRVEKEKGWKVILEDTHIKLIVMTESQLHKAPTLQGHLRRSSADQTCYLGEVPLLLIPELRTLFHQPELKISIWHTLQALMKNDASR